MSNNMKTNNSTWEFYNKTLEALSADRELKFTNLPPFVNTMIAPLDKNTAMMNIRVNMLKKLCNPEPNSIIEIGGAYGNLGVTYQNTKPNLDYTLVDTKSMLKFAKVFFEVKGKKASLICPEEIENAVKNYDLFCTYCAISETPELYQDKVLKTFLPKCKSAMITEVPKNVPKYSNILEEYYETIKILDAPKGHSNKHMIIFATDLRE